MTKFDRNLCVRVFGEFCASLMYICLGCMSTDDVASASDGILFWGLNFGLSAMSAYQTFSCVSGAYMNPCVTIAAMILRKIDWVEGIFYILVEFLGAFAGYSIAYGLMPKQTGFCVTVPHSDMHVAECLLIEFICTCTWVFCMCAIWDARNEIFRESICLRILMIVAGSTISGAHFTGGSMNPARSLPPAVFTGTYEGIWIYFTSPILAAVIVAIVWKYVFSPSSNDAAAGGAE